MDRSKMYDPQDYDQYLVKLMFDMNITEIAGLDASFKISVRESICTALDLPASVVVPEEITGDPSVGDNMALSLVMFGPNIKAYVTKMYDQILNPNSLLRQGQYTKKAVTAEVNKVCMKEQCQEVKRMTKERDIYDDEADLARKEFFRLHLQSEATRQAALDAEKAVALLHEELKTMEGDLAELRSLADAYSVSAAESNLMDFKRNLREHIESATKTAALAKTLMEDVARARQDAQLKTTSSKDVSRQWTKTCHKAITGCDLCNWGQELLKYGEGQYRYPCPNYCGYVSGFFEMNSHFCKCDVRPTAEQIAREQRVYKAKAEEAVRSLLAKSQMEFEGGKAELTEKGRAVVGEVSRELHKLPRGSTIEIHGHTACPTQGTHKTIEECANDNNPKNLALIRCIAVIHAFEAQGLAGRAQFVPVPWGCTEPSIGCQRLVRIFIK